jgi:methylphosphotriester-DNA--protein-cysteine methyltransferase
MKKENRVFFSSAEHAQQMGFRPCGRCLPNAYREWKCCSDGFKNLEREEEHGADEFEYKFQRKTNNSKGQRKQPQNGENKNQHQGQRPAEYEQNTPK